MNTAILLPLPEELRRVMVDEMRVNGPAEYLLDYLDKLQMGCWADAAGNYWFGFEDTEYAESHRWLYMLRAEDIQVYGYAPSSFAAISQCGPAVIKKPGTPDIVAALAHLWREQAYLVAEHGYVLEAERLRLARNFMVGASEFGLMFRPQMRSVLDARWGQDLHDVLHHWDDWSETNNSAGLPQEIALRMYGLGAYVDARNRGYDWLS